MPVPSHFVPQYPALSRFQNAMIALIRTEFSQGEYSNSQLPPKADRINKVMATLKQIMKEAGLRYGFPSLAEGIPPLKDIPKLAEPFTWDEITLFLENVRPDFRNYYTVRFLTGLRTGEIDGLRWQSIDFERREIFICEAIVNGKMEAPKTVYSRRAIKMTQPVYDALRDQEKATRHRSEFVFCLRSGKPLAHGNVTKRVWYPTLRRLGLKERTPYQTRHTTASLWMAARENPEWIARQLGHANTQMLFKTYSRYMPNALRQDGSEFEQIAQSKIGGSDKQ